MKLVPSIPLFLIALTISTGTQSAPVAAPFAGGALFVWKEGSSLRAGIYRSAAPIAKSIALPGERCSITPADDFALLLCTNADNSVTAVRVNPQGDEMPPRKTLPLPAPVWAAWNGSRFLAASVDRIGQITNQFFDRNVDPLGPPHWVFRAAPNEVQSASVAALGDRFLYVIQEILPNNCGVLCPIGGGKIIVQPIDNSGTPLSEIVVTADGVESRFAVNGDELALVWRNFSSYGIHARRIAAGGTFRGDDVVISGGRAFAPRVVWDGQLFDVSFRRDVLRAIAPGVDVIDRRLVGLARLTADLTTLSLLEAPLVDAAPSELVVAGDHLLRAYVVGSRIVVDELALRPRGRAVLH